MKLRLPSRARTLHLPAETRPRRQALIEMIAGLLELVAALLVTLDALRRADVLVLNVSRLLLALAALLQAQSARHAARAAFLQVVFFEAGGGEGGDIAEVRGRFGGGIGVGVVGGDGAVAGEAGGRGGAGVGGRREGSGRGGCGSRGCGASGFFLGAALALGGLAVAELGEEAADALAVFLLLLLDVRARGGGALAGFFDRLGAGRGSGGRSGDDGGGDGGFLNGLLGYNGLIVFDSSILIFFVLGAAGEEAERALTLLLALALTIFFVVGLGLAAGLDVRDMALEVRLVQLGAPGVHGRQRRADDFIVISAGTVGLGRFDALFALLSVSSGGDGSSSGASSDAVGLFFANVAALPLGSES